MRRLVMPRAPWEQRPAPLLAPLHDNRFAINDCNAIIDCMASITIRNLEETTKRKLKVRAAMNGRSMEHEARETPSSALRQKPKTGADLVEAIRKRFAPFGGVDLEPYPRQPMHDPDWLKDRK